MTDAVADLCAHLGVQAAYRGFDGQTIDVSPDTRLSMLHALGLEVRTDAEARSILNGLRAEDARRPLPPEVVVIAGQPSQLTLAHAADWALVSEGSGEILADGFDSDRICLPAAPLGIHRLQLRSSKAEFTTWVLARPAKAVQLSDVLPAPRIWGVSAALYGLTDGAAAPIGTYDLLGAYAAQMARHGADFLGINPVHAMGDVRPDDVVSPYSPSHREFLNTWHCAGNTGTTRGDKDLIDYPAALRDNRQALDAQFAAFRSLPDCHPQKREFAAFSERAGAPLHDFAVFEAIAALHDGDWRQWPARYRDKDADALAALDAAHSEAITRTKWAQWQAEMRLGQAQQTARAAGMRIGLFLDLAVGPRLAGAETWVRNSTLVTTATLGAPPDPLGPSGQSWGLAPQSPLKMRADGYAGFARLLRANMRHAGMLRVDHILGLMRSFWLPDGCSEGAYVSYPFDALLAVVAIESARSGTIVVGEDLGLVPAGLREKLSASGIYGLDVLQFMRTDTGAFVDPTEMRQLAVGTFATHDTPTIAGYFAAEDVRTRHQLGEIDAETLRLAIADRQRAKHSLASPDPVTDIHRRLAKSNASMVAIQLDDLAKRVSQQNLPGTVDTYPNWRRKAPFTFNEIERSQAFASLASDMRAQGRSNSNHTETENELQDCSDQTH